MSYEDIKNINSPTIRCIYCKQVKESSKEHVLQKSLGGNLTIRFVCKECNNNFSKIDQDLAENSLVAMSRIVIHDQDEKVLLGGESFWKDDDGYVREMEVRGRLKARIKPQVGFIQNDDKYELKFGCDNQKDILLLLEVIKKYVQENRLTTIHIKASRDESKGFIPSLILHRGKELYFRPSSNIQNPKEYLYNIQEKMTLEKIDFILGELQNPGKLEQKVYNKPKISHHLSFNFNNIYRAIAKTMFNILAHSQGIDFVLREEFDDVRNYIIGRDIKSMPVIDDEVDYDTRFVHMLPSNDRPDFVNALINEDKHIAMLNNCYPYICGAINFYGQNAYLINLGKLACNQDIFEFYEFDSSIRKHTVKDSFSYIKDLIQRDSSIFRWNK